MTFTVLKSGITNLVSEMTEPQAADPVPFEVTSTTLMLEGRVVPWHDVKVCDSAEKWHLELVLSGHPVSIPFGGSQHYQASQQVECYRH